MDAAIVAPTPVRHGFHQQPHPTTEDRLDQPAYHGHCFARVNTAAVVTHHRPGAAAPRSSLHRNSRPTRAGRRCATSRRPNQAAGHLVPHLPAQTHRDPAAPAPRATGPAIPRVRPRPLLTIRAPRCSWIWPKPTESGRPRHHSLTGEARGRRAASCRPGHAHRAGRIWIERPQLRPPRKGAERRRDPAAAASTRALPGGGPRRRRGRRHRWRELLDGGGWVAARVA